MPGGSESELPGPSRRRPSGGGRQARALSRRGSRSRRKRTSTAPSRPRTSEPAKRSSACSQARQSRVPATCRAWPRMASATGRARSAAGRRRLPHPEVGGAVRWLMLLRWRRRRRGVYAGHASYPPVALLRAPWRVPKPPVFNASDVLVCLQRFDQFLAQPFSRRTAVVGKSHCLLDDVPRCRRDSPA